LEEEFDQTVAIGEVGQAVGATHVPLFHTKYWQVDPEAPQSAFGAVLQSWGWASCRTKIRTMKKRRDLAIPVANYVSIFI
jgi:hypothetical protein